MRKIKACEECGCEEQQPGGNLLQRIWEAQLGNHREIILNSVIDSSVVEMVVIQIQNINKEDDAKEAAFAGMALSGFQRDPIKLFISSPGGSVDLSFAVVSAIEMSRTPVYTIAVGAAMSGGFLILLAGHKRYAQRYATLMYHELSSGTGGKATEIREYGEHLDVLQDRIKAYVLANTLIEEYQLDDCHLRKTDWYMTVEEALDLCVIDGIWGCNEEATCVEDAEVDPEEDVEEPEETRYDRQDSCC